MKSQATRNVVFAATPQETHEVWGAAKDADVYYNGRYIGYRNAEEHRVIDAQVRAVGKQQTEQGS